MTSKWSVSRVVSLKKKIQTHRHEINNETATRYALIDPVLRDLGWRLENPHEVKYEEGKEGRWDYNLENRLLIEAKKLGGIKDRDEAQLIDYLRKNDMMHGVLTDGNKWSMWTVSEDGVDQDFDTRIDQGRSDKIYDKLNKLNRDIIRASIKPHDPKHTHKQKPDTDVYKNNTSVPISEFQPGKTQPPITLICGDNQQPIKCEKWNQILVSVAEYLINNNHINKSNCPIRLGSKTAILNTSEYHQTGIKMNNYKKLRQDWFLNVNLNAKCIISVAEKLIKYAGLQTSDFRISLQDTKPTISSTNDKKHTKKEHTEEMYLSKKSHTIKKIYLELRNTIFKLDKTIKIIPKKQYIIFRTTRNFMWIVIWKASIDVTFDAPHSKLHDPKNIVQDVSKVGHWGRGNLRIKITNKSEIPYVLDIIKQIL